MKRLLPLLCALLLLSACGPALPEETDQLQIAAAVFPAYDFARAAAGGRADVTLLLPPIFSSTWAASPTRGWTPSSPPSSRRGRPCG